MYSNVEWETAENSPRSPHKHIQIIIKDPIKHGQGSQAFVSYLVVSHHQVRRRFQDFVQLHRWLQESHSQCIIPPLPGKHRMEYVTGDRFSKEFLDKRMVGLQCFLDRVSRHPVLSQSVCLEKFLEADQMVILSYKALVDTQVTPKSKTVFDSMGEVFINAFSKVKDDDEYLQLKASIEKNERNLSKIETTHYNLLKTQQELSRQFLIFGQAIESLGQMETHMQKFVTETGQEIVKYSETIKSRTEKDDLEYIIPFGEYVQYFNSVRETLKIRDQKKLDVQELERYYLVYCRERDEMLSRGSNNRLSQFFQATVNNMKGVDPERSRLEKMQKLDEKIKTLEVAKVEAAQESELFDKTLQEELDFFNNNKIEDFKALLESRKREEIEFHANAVKFWGEQIDMIMNASFVYQNDSAGE